MLIRPLRTIPVGNRIGNGLPEPNISPHQMWKEHGGVRSDVNPENWEEFPRPVRVRWGRLSCEALGYGGPWHRSLIACPIGISHFGRWSHLGEGDGW